MASFPHEACLSYAAGLELHDAHELQSANSSKAIPFNKGLLASGATASAAPQVAIEGGRNAPEAGPITRETAASGRRHSHTNKSGCRQLETCPALFRLHSPPFSQEPALWSE